MSSATIRQSWIAAEPDATGGRPFRLTLDFVLTDESFLYFSLPLAGRYVLMQGIAGLTQAGAGFAQGQAYVDLYNPGTAMSCEGLWYPVNTLGANNLGTNVLDMYFPLSPYTLQCGLKVTGSSTTQTESFIELSGVLY